MEDGNSRYRSSRDRTQREYKRPRSPPRRNLVDTKEEGEIQNEDEAHSVQKHLIDPKASNGKVERPSESNPIKSAEVKIVSVDVELEGERVWNL